MAFFRREWRPRHLLLAWLAYWLGLALVTLGRPALEAWRLSRRPDAHGSVSAGFENALGTLTMVVDGTTVWTGSASLTAITGWLVGPPLLLWVVWLLLPRRAGTLERRAGLASSPDPRALHAPVPAELEPRRDRPAAARAERTDVQR